MKGFERLVADVLGREVLVARERDATLLGTAMCAAVGVGAYNSLTEAAEGMGERWSGSSRTGHGGRGWKKSTRVAGALRETRRDIGKHVMKWESERTIVVQAAQHLLRLGLVAATSGNVSMRLEGGGEEGLIAITPTSRDYEKMTAEDIVVVDYDVDVVEGETVPSSESLTHVAVYKARQDIQRLFTLTRYTPACWRWRELRCRQCWTS